VVQHLKRLEAAQLVDATLQGRRQLYRTNPSGLVPLARWLTRHTAE
jgi:DNA-binding PadR family transcriptional regulator